MNKRQRKKNEKKYLPVIADEANLLTMTAEEQQKAFDDYMEFKKKHAYRKRYKDLNEGKILRYYYPIGNEIADTLRKLSDVTKSARSKS